METIGASLTAEASAATTSHYSSPTFNAAVATSWFIRAVGIASIFCAIPKNRFPRRRNQR